MSLVRRVRRPRPGRADDADDVLQRAEGPRIGETSAEAYRASLTERDLLASVEELAVEHGWRVYHTHTSIHSAGGFPDLVMLRPLDPQRPDGPVRQIAAELKNAWRRVEAEQLLWLDLFRRVPGGEAYVWRPEDWYDGSITETLR